MTLGIAILFACLGAVLASFTGVISERIYTGQSWSRGRSRCNSCRRELNALDLVPVFSWLLSRGRCRTCKARVPATYAIAEFILGVVFAVAYLWLMLSYALIVFCAATTVLCFIVLYDLRHTIVPPLSSILLFVFCTAFTILAYPLQTLLYTTGIAVVLGIAFLLLFVLSRGRAMGMGDAPVVFSLSLLVGGQQALSGLAFSFWIGAVIGIFILLMRRGGPTMGIEVPFVPFMAAGYLIAFFTQWNPFPF